MNELTPGQRAYQDFLQTDEWKRLRDAVMRRAGYICEACLNATATQVHHVGYEHGWLPPAWKLRAVCEPCHERLENAEPF